MSLATRALAALMHLPPARMWGASDLGLTQWSVAGDLPPWMRALAMGVTSADFREGVVYPRGILALESMLGWAADNQRQARSLRDAVRRRRHFARVLPDA